MGYKIKYHPNGSMEGYKALLIAKGYNQQEVLAYFETFTPVAKLVNIYVSLVLATTHNWHLQQPDVKNDFLYDDLDENVYMHLPTSFEQKQEIRVCKLNKSPNGHKQASRQWFAKFFSTILDARYKISNADYSLLV